MSKHDPSESELGFNPYILDTDTHYKLNYSHYAVESFAHRRRLNKWKKLANDRALMAKRLGVVHAPKLTSTADILQSHISK